MRALIPVLLLLACDPDPPCAEGEVCDTGGGGDDSDPLDSESDDISETADSSDSSDTVDTGDTVESGDTSDTSDSGDTSEPVDTSDTSDTSDTGDVSDSSDTGPVDADGDGFTSDEDCDDADPEVNPDAIEVCNGKDDDCDRIIDPGDAADAQLWFPDCDGDGVGSGWGTSYLQCFEPELGLAACLDDRVALGWANQAGDCDDLDGDAFPGALDAPGDDRDADCGGGDWPEPLFGAGVYVSSPANFQRPGEDTPGCGTPEAPCATLAYAADLALDGEALFIATGAYDAPADPLRLVLVGSLDPETWEPQASVVSPTPGTSIGRIDQVSPLVLEAHDRWSAGFRALTVQGSSRALTLAVAQPGPDGPSGVWAEDAVALSETSDGVAVQVGEGVDLRWRGGMLHVAQGTALHVELGATARFAVQEAIDPQWGYPSEYPTSILSEDPSRGGAAPAAVTVAPGGNLILAWGTLEGGAAALDLLGHATLTDARVLGGADAIRIPGVANPPSGRSPSLRVEGSLIEFGVDARVGDVRGLDTRGIHATYADVKLNRSRVVQTLHPSDATNQPQLAFALDAQTCDVELVNSQLWARRAVQETIAARTGAGSVGARGTTRAAHVLALAGESDVGGAWFHEGGSLTLVNSVLHPGFVTGSNAHVVGRIARNPTIYLANVHLWASTGSGLDIDADGRPLTWAQAGSSANWPTPPQVTVSGLQGPADPGFASWSFTGITGLGLNFNSPLLDAGTASYPTGFQAVWLETDLSNNPRPRGAAPDIGPTERQ